MYLNGTCIRFDVFILSLVEVMVRIGIERWILVRSNVPEDRKPGICE